MRKIQGSIYFIGIGGIGMSALARYFLLSGYSVSGYDKTETQLTEKLSEEGIQIHYEQDTKKIPDNTELAVYTPAISNDFEELLYIRSKNIPLLKRAEILSEIVNSGNLICIAGTHGKTTITSLIAHIFKSSGKSVLAFVGGIMKNYDSNFIFSEKPEVIIAEADEYDHSFLRLTPDTAVISAVEPDHLDIYGSFEKVKTSFRDFVQNIKVNGKLIAHTTVKDTLKYKNIKNCTYGNNQNAEFKIVNLEKVENKYRFDVTYNGKIVFYSVCSRLPGRHNLENLCGALAVASHYGLEGDDVVRAVSTFEGVKRRFDVRISRNDIVFIDDYAHHPSEISAFLNGVREFYPEKKITGIFQPHLFSRTRDFAVDFAKSLELLDIPIVTDIYPAREEPIDGVDANSILKNINSDSKLYIPKDKVLEYIHSHEVEVLVTIGAGDIDILANDIEDYFKQNQ